jgi:nucleoside-diphosphate-sugar epimerase
MRKVLVTGGTGFLGQHLARRLAASGDAVTVVGRNRKLGQSIEGDRIRFCALDLEDGPAVASALAGHDLIVHAAGLASPFGPRAAFVGANVTATAHVLEASRRAGVRRVVFVSTPSIYFDHRDRVGIREDDPLPARAATPYAETKLEAERMVAQAHGAALETLSIRPCRVFGPGDRNVLPRLLRAAGPRGVPLIRGGIALVDMTYIDNVTDALVACLDAPASACGRAYNITNGEPRPLAELCGLLFGALGRSVRVRSVPYPLAYGAATALELGHRLLRRPGEPALTRYAVGLMARSQTLDIGRARQDLGYAPRVSLAEGFTRFAAWWKTVESA